MPNYWTKFGFLHINSKTGFSEANQKSMKQLSCKLWSLLFRMIKTLDKERERERHTHRPVRQVWRRLSREREWDDWWGWNFRWATVPEEHKAEHHLYQRKTLDKRQHFETQVCSTFSHLPQHQNQWFWHCVVSRSVSDHDRICFRRRNFSH